MDVLKHTQIEDSSLNSDEDIPDYVNNKKILIKFGGNAMTSPAIQENVIDNICELKDNGFQVVVVHGGGPAIREMLDLAGIESEFIGGHRKTDKEAITYVEMALKGRVNGELVRLINAKGQSAVGISGKDGLTVKAKKRFHKVVEKGKEHLIDLGLVGDVDIINPNLINQLLSQNYIPVLAPIAYGHDFENYNINADMFAGHMAAALGCEHFVALTDIDGLLKDKNDPSTLIEKININELKSVMGSIIEGGMIPKVESCINAVEHGVNKAHIVNGTSNNMLRKIFIDNQVLGTIITQ